MDALKLLRAERQRLREARAYPQPDSGSASLLSSDVSKKSSGEVKETPEMAAHRRLSAVAPIQLARPPHLDLASYRVGTIPSVYYVPDFISEGDAVKVLSCIENAGLNDKWVRLRGRQLQNWGGVPPDTYEPLPQWLQEVIHQAVSCCCACSLGWRLNNSVRSSQVSSTLLSCGLFPPSSPTNHVLVNQYHPGQGASITGSAGSPH